MTNSRPSNVEPAEIVLGSINHYPTRLAKPPSAQYLGGRIAHTELLRNLLSTGAVDRIELFPALGPGTAQRLEREVFAHFAATDYDPALGVPRLSSWEGLLTNSAPSVFISSLPWTQRLAQLRLPSGEPRPGIASIVHSVPWPDLLAAYWSLGATASEADVIVATSRAAERAVRQLLAWCSRGHRKKAPRKLVRIPLGVDVVDIPPSASGFARKSLEIDHDRVVVLFLGRLDPIYKADLAPLLVA